MERRKFLSESSRWLLLGGLLGTSGFLVYKSATRDPKNCYVSPFCTGCNLSNSCETLAYSKTGSNEKEGRK